MNIPKIEKYLKEQQIPSFRLKQLKQAYFVEYKASWDELSTWSKDLKEKISEQCPWFSFEAKKIQKDTKNNTAKALLKLKDDNTIETVLIRTKTRQTVCLSSQVGCPMNCGFCATGQSGFTRNLTTEEIVDQIIFWNNYLKKEDKKVTSVVFMGMGEPFMNWLNVKDAISTIADPEGVNLSQRHITVSTCGIVDKIKTFAEEFPQANLAVSLHSAVGRTRNQIMPVNHNYPLDKLINECLNYVEKTNRKLFFEYTLLEGINDTNNEIDALAKLIKQHYLFHLNLIPYNSTGAKFKSTNKDRLSQITNLLEKKRVHYTIRRSMGDEVEAACGQLRTRDNKKTSKNFPEKSGRAFKDKKPAFRKSKR